MKICVKISKFHEQPNYELCQEYYGLSLDSNFKYCNLLIVQSKYLLHQLFAIERMNINTAVLSLHYLFHERKT